MKRVLLIALVMVMMSTEALAVTTLKYSDEVEEFFSGKAIHPNCDLKFVEYACEIPDGFYPAEVRCDAAYRYRIGVASYSTGYAVYVKYVDNVYYVLKLKRQTCGDQSECDQYKALFDPPASDCNFSVELVWQCKDGEGNVLESTYKITSSDGRSESFTLGDRGEVQCDPTISICSGGEEACSTPFNPSDDPGMKVDDPVGNFPIIVIPGGEGGGTGGTGGTGGDDGGTRGTGGTGGDGGTGGTGGTGGDDGGTGGTGGDGGTGGTGGGTIIGGGGGGNGDGDGTGFDGNFGSEQDGLDSINKDGWGDEKGEYSLERGQGEHKEYLDGLANKGPLREIKEHSYINTSGGYCSVSLTLFNRTHVLSLCEHQQQINSFGRLLLSLAGLSGLFIILRR